MSDRELLAPAEHIFVSPHYDDIPLSCGGTVARLTGAGHPARIVIVFGSPPEPPLTEFARQQHDRWGVSAEGVIKARQAEESVANAVLGSSWLALPFADAIYRGERYLSDSQLFGPVAADENSLISAVSDYLLELASNSTFGRVRFYVPLGVGNHVDHQLCHEVGHLLANAGAEVWCYEDLPYALRADATADCLTRLASNPGTSLLPLPPVAIRSFWDRKLAAILAYPSQVPSIFRHVSTTGQPAEIDAALRAGAAVNGQLCERFWRLAVAPGTR